MMFGGIAYLPDVHGWLSRNEDLSPRIMGEKRMNALILLLVPFVVMINGHVFFTLISSR